MKDFNSWWDEDDLTTPDNPFTDGTFAYWAWEGWYAGVKSEREACANAMAYLVMTPTLTHGVLVKLSDVVNAIRARGKA